MPGAYDLKEGRQWWDTQLSVKGSYTFANCFYVGGGALAGGNSYGQATDLMLLAAYRFDETVSEFLGYRRLATSYEVSCGFLFDAVAHRPRFGLDYHF